MNMLGLLDSQWLSKTDTIETRANCPVQKEFGYIEVSWWSFVWTNLRCLFWKVVYLREGWLYSKACIWTPLESHSCAYLLGGLICSRCVQPRLHLIVDILEMSAYRSCLLVDVQLYFDYTCAMLRPIQILVW